MPSLDWMYNSLGSSFLAQSRHHHTIRLDQQLTSGRCWAQTPDIGDTEFSLRFRLEHHVLDGLDKILEAYGEWETNTNPASSHVTDIPAEDIEAIRNATIITVIEFEGAEVTISTSDSENPEQANSVTFTPGTAVNITNPLNGETVEVGQHPERQP